MKFYNPFKRPQQAPAKSYPTFDGMPGLSYQNQDFTFSEEGFSLAYSTVTSVYRAINVRADAIAGLKWSLVRYTGQDAQDKQVIVSSDNSASHPFGRALQMSSIQNGVGFWKLFSLYADLYGENYLEFAERGIGLKILNPLYTQPYIANGGIEFYRYNPPYAGGVQFTPEEIAFYHTFNPTDNFRGLSNIAPALQSARISRNLQRFVSAFFINSARPAVILTPSNEMDILGKEQREMIRRELQDFYKGVGQAYGTWVSSIPMNAETFDQPDIANNYSVMQSISQEIYSAFGVPPLLIGDTSSAPYKEGVEIRNTFLQITIYPLAMAYQDFVNNSIIPKLFTNENVRFEFDTSFLAVISESDLTRANYASTLYTSGIATKNEARELVNLPALIETPAPETTPLEPSTMMSKSACDVHQHDDLPRLIEPSGVGSIRSQAMDELIKAKAYYSARMDAIAPYRFVLAGSLVDFEGVYTLADKIKVLDNALAQLSVKKAYIKTAQEIVISTIGKRPYKGVIDLQPAFAERFNILMEKASAGDEEATRELFFDLVQVFGLEAFSAGLREGGVLLPSASDMEQFTAFLASQEDYVRDFVRRLVSGEISEKQAENEAALWFNGSIQPAFALALTLSKDDPVYQWREGDTVEKCTDCLRLDKQIHRLSDWKRRDLIPPTKTTKCGGWQCKCQLVKVVGKEFGNW